MRASLQVVSGDAKPATVDVSRDKPLTIGRGRGSDLVIARDEHASRNHAKIYQENNRWFLQDQGLNGTKLDGQRIEQVAELNSGAEIRIGEVVLRFTYTESPGGKGSGSNNTTVSASNDESVTIVHGEELDILCRYMALAVETKDKTELVRIALRTLLAQIQATAVGFLDFNSGEPTALVTLPGQAELDSGMSRYLTRRVERDKKPIWLQQPGSTAPNPVNLETYADAICIPLLIDGHAVAALHAYRVKKKYTARDMRFTEAVAGYLTQALKAMREHRRYEAESSRLKAHTASDELLGESAAVVQMRGQIAKAATQPGTVLISGEPGVGKELVALTIHRKSPRANGPFVVVNCAAIPHTLIEAELFGYKQGTFTGATRDYAGLFMQADEGTLFLDEVTDLPLDLQLKLDRVIESKTFRPIGSMTDVKSDARIMVATSRKLQGEVDAKRFRGDLHTRISTMEIDVPPLRERLEDVPMLTQFFLDRLGSECRRHMKILPTAMREMQNYNWPGNVRQLRAMLENVVTMHGERDTIDIELVRRLLPSSHATYFDPPTSLNWEDLERWSLERALRKCEGNISQAAQIVGASRDTLYIKMKKYNLSREDARAGRHQPQVSSQADR